MIYLHNDDLNTDSYQRFIDESAENNPDLLDKAELRAIELVKTYMAGRYDTQKIFDPQNPVRNEVLVDILCKITLHKLFGRNAARKKPSDIKEDYQEAMRQLEKINAGSTRLENLPKPEDERGTPISQTIYGNNTNPDFYI